MLAKDTFTIKYEAAKRWADNMRHHETDDVVVYFRVLKNEQRVSGKPHIRIERVTRDN